MASVGSHRIGVDGVDSQIDYRIGARMVREGDPSVMHQERGDQPMRGDGRRSPGTAARRCTGIATGRCTRMATRRCTGVARPGDARDGGGGSGTLTALKRVNRTVVGLAFVKLRATPGLASRSARQFGARASDRDASPPFRQQNGASPIEA